VAFCGLETKTRKLPFATLSKSSIRVDVQGSRAAIRKMQPASQVGPPLVASRVARLRLAEKTIVAVPLHLDDSFSVIIRFG
jgi:hypothetical protein